MVLSYEIFNGGYIIKNNDTKWIKQDSYIPYPAATLAESAQLHIQSILDDRAQPAPPSPEELIKRIDLMQQAIDDIILGGGF